MRRLVLALVSSLAVAGLAAVTSSSVAAAPTPNAIVTAQVTAGGTWTDPNTLQVHRYYTVTIDFGHRGSTEARVTQYAAPTDEVGIDSDHAWFKGSGADTFVGSVVGGLVGQPVYFKLFLYQRGPHRQLHVVDSLTLGPYTS